MIYFDKGYIGCFEMTDKESGKHRLTEYIRQLQNTGHKRIIAPINGDTWHQYRLVSWSNGDPSFPLEPKNPLWYNEVYKELGFKPLMKYRSDKFNIVNDISIVNDNDNDNDNVNTNKNNVNTNKNNVNTNKNNVNPNKNNVNPNKNTDSSLNIRNFREGDPKLIQAGDPKLIQDDDPKLTQDDDPKLTQSGDPKLIQDDDPELTQAGDLRLIYNISLHGFEGNFLYSDITYEEFSKLYSPIMPIIDNELVVIAEVNGTPVGFMFSFIVNGTQILKSMAVLPKFRSKGIGTKLINHVLIAGQRKGAKTAIAAMISDGNNSSKIVEKCGGEKIREYTLYCLEE